MLMVQIKKYYESVSGNTVDTTEYDELQISPIHIHKNKNLHRVALLALGNEIVMAMDPEKERPASAFTQESGTTVVAEH